ncbi:hypothetical protein CK203_053826 [Vitis vinifera]|uniref:Auxin-responsive protein SAUR32 n=1 Tax=Vitis vinifera TaxID=29760 RepID=A0A438GRM8_VITVI|nr:hypothetical protein CK203_053826 [Vitis vinifera]
MRRGKTEPAKERSLCWLGGEVMERLMIPTKMIKHPYIVALLEMPANEFGYQKHGTIKIPCDVECPRRTIEMISKEKRE